jgi:uncharacterized protein YbjT (DUF2867 family)
MSSQGRKIAMVGATGTVGSETLKSLLNTNLHTITAISRERSEAAFPAGIEVKKGDYSNHSFLVSALKGQDVLIMQLSIEAMESQTAFIHAASEAGVRWVLPTEFGSDIHSQIAKDFPMMSMKNKFRDLIEEKGMSWVAVVNNPWFDWSLKAGLWNVDIPGRKATIFDVGNAKFNTTTLAQVGRGVAALLSLPEDKLMNYKNNAVYIRSFLLNQRDILDSAIRVTGTKESEWEIKTQDPAEAIQAARDAVAAGNMMAFIGEFYTTHMLEGRGGNFEEKAVKDMAVLGLEGENLDEVIQRVVGEMKTSS